MRTSGTNGEGIETKSMLNITGGEVASYAYDDAINSKGDMTISGGSTVSLSSYTGGTGGPGGPGGGRPGGF